MNYIYNVDLGTHKKGQSQLVFEECACTEITLGSGSHGQLFQRFRSTIEVVRCKSLSGRRNANQREETSV